MIAADVPALGVALDREGPLGACVGATTASKHASITTSLLAASFPGLEVTLGFDKTLAADVPALGVALGLEESLMA